MFACLNCKRKVDEAAIGTKHRNHCPFCLWSLHVDENVSGDRKSECHGPMEPTGLTFKNKGVDKYGKKIQGEIMLVHRCIRCNKISLNRLAGDDDPQKVLEILDAPFLIDMLQHTKQEGIELLTKNDKEEVARQLFGGKSNTRNSKSNER